MLNSIGVAGGIGGNGFGGVGGQGGSSGPGEGGGLFNLGAVSLSGKTTTWSINRADGGAGGKGGVGGNGDGWSGGDGVERRCRRRGRVRSNWWCRWRRRRGASMARAAAS